MSNVLEPFAPSLELAQKQFFEGATERAFATLDALCETSASDRAVLVDATLLRAQIVWQVEDLDAALPWAVEADTLAAELAAEDPIPRIKSLIMVIEMMAADRNLDAVAELSGVLAGLAEIAELPHVASQAWASRAEHSMALDRPVDGMEAAEAALAVSDDSDDTRHARARSLVILGRLARLQGDAERAVTLLREAASQHDDEAGIIVVEPAFETELLVARVRAGDSDDDMQEVFERLAASESGLDPDSRLALALAHIEFHLAGGRLEAADRVAEAVQGLDMQDYAKVRADTAGGDSAAAQSWVPQITD